MDETLGKRISAHRKALGLTQDALAEKLSITAQAVSKWENDQSCPDINMLPKLAEIFSCTTDELLGISPKEVHMEEIPFPEDPPEMPEKIPSRSRWKALASPVAAFGIWLFLTGLVTLLDSVRPYPETLVDHAYRCSFWDIAISCGIFAFGLCALLRRFSFLRLACTGFGSICVLNLITQPGITDMDWRIPLCAGLALFGLDLLLDTLLGRKRTVPAGHLVPSCMRNSFDCEANSFSCATSFGQDRHPITMALLSQGHAEVSFGELTLDLTGCHAFAENSQLTLHCSFGELTVLIPQSCRAENNIRTAFAQCDTFGTPSPEAEARIYVNGATCFGHITIRYV